MTKLYLVGHGIRGSEVLELLELLGGKNTQHITDFSPNLLYYVSEKTKRIEAAYDAVVSTPEGCDYTDLPSDVCVYTLEEFYQKYPYHIGDRVIVDTIDRMSTEEHLGTISKIMWTDHKGTVLYGVTFDYGFTLNYYVNEIRPYIGQDEIKPYTDEYEEDNSIFR